MYVPRVYPRGPHLIVILGSLLMALVCSKDDFMGFKRPNILLILADDVGTGDIPSYWGTGKVKMPNIDDLVAKGIMFTDAHSTPLCAPSRYILLSGNYQHRGTNRGGTWTVGSDSQFKSDQQSVAQVLRDGGNYHTAMYGKWHLGGMVPPNGIRPSASYYEDLLRNEGHNWTLPLGQGPQDIGFDSSLITIGGIQSPPYVFLRDGYITTQVANVTYWDVGTYPMRQGMSMIRTAGEGAPGWDSTAYNMILVNETVNFLDDHLSTRAADPFFAYVALGSVHIPHSPPYFYLDDTAVAGKHETSHMDLLGEMDKVVMSLVEALKERQLLKDTIIVFTSDNGGLASSKDYNHMPSGPLRDNKGSIYEGGHRVPLVMRWDGTFPSGTNRTQLVGLNDLFSTLCEFARVEIPQLQAQDSVSFANYIQSGNTEGLRQYLCTWKYNDADEAAIRKSNFKLIRKSSQDVELYDLENDLSESNDISSDPAHQEMIREMLTVLSSIELEDPPPRHCSGQDTFNVEGLSTKMCCKWARRKQKRRCKDFPEVRENCPLLCPD
jgi:arylsulfatase A-like enzyme